MEKSTWADLLQLWSSAATISTRMLSQTMADPTWPSATSHIPSGPHCSPCRPSVVQSDGPSPWSSQASRMASVLLVMSHKNMTIYILGLKSELVLTFLYYYLFKVQILWYLRCVFAVVSSLTFKCTILYALTYAPLHYKSVESWSLNPSQQLSVLVSAQLVIQLQFSWPVPAEFSSDDLRQMAESQSSFRARVSKLTSPLSCEGGEFTRQAEVTFLPENEKLTIKQEFKGIDEHDHLVVSTTLNGRVPEVPEGATVQVNPFSEIYQYSNNCKLQSEKYKHWFTQSDSSHFPIFQIKQTLIHYHLFWQWSHPPPPGTTLWTCLTDPPTPGRISGVRPSPSRAASTTSPTETWNRPRCSTWTRYLSCMTPVMSSSGLPWATKSGTSTVRSWRQFPSSCFALNTLPSWSTIHTVYIILIKRWLKSGLWFGFFLILKTTGLWNSNDNFFGHVLILRRAARRKPLFHRKTWMWHKRCLQTRRRKPVYLPVCCWF